MKLFTHRSSSEVKQKPAEIDQIMQAFLAQTKHIVVANSSRSLDELEIALGFGIALMWRGQLTFWSSVNEGTARQFRENHSKTSVVSVAMAIVGLGDDSLGDDPVFKSALKRLRPDCELYRELGCVFGQLEGSDRSNHLVNNVAVAAQQFVTAFVAGKSSAIVHIIDQLSPVKQVSIAQTWINRLLGTRECEIFLPNRTADVLSGKGAIWHPDIWNEVCDRTVKLSLIKGYKLQQLSNQLVGHMRAQGLMSAETEVELRALGKIR